MKLIRHEMLKINYLDKLPFKGSYQGIRYIFEKKIDKITETDGAEEKNEDEGKSMEIIKLSLCVYPDKFCFEDTDESLKKYYYFEYTNEGIDQGIEKLNEENQWS